MHKVVLEEGPEAIRSIEGTALDGDEDFFKFRSWLRGGQLLIDHEEDQWYANRLVSSQGDGDGAEGTEASAPVDHASLPGAMHGTEGTRSQTGSSSAFEDFSDGETPRQRSEKKDGEGAKSSGELEEFTPTTPAERLKARSAHLLSCCAKTLMVLSPK